MKSTSIMSAYSLASNHQLTPVHTKCKDVPVHCARLDQADLQTMSLRPLLGPDVEDTVEEMVLVN